MRGVGGIVQLSNQNRFKFKARFKFKTRISSGSNNLVEMMALKFALKLAWDKCA